ncbi:MAG: hypothetical protein ACOC9W_06265 [Persicimonas sp.]
MRDEIWERRAAKNDGLRADPPKPEYTDFAQGIRAEIEGVLDDVIEPLVTIVDAYEKDGQVVVCYDFDNYESGYVASTLIGDRTDEDLEADLLEQISVSAYVVTRDEY